MNLNLEKSQDDFRAESESGFSPALFIGGERYLPEVDAAREGGGIVRREWCGLLFVGDKEGYFDGGGGGTLVGRDPGGHRLDEADGFRFKVGVYEAHDLDRAD